MALIRGMITTLHTRSQTCSAKCREYGPTQRDAPRNRTLVQANSAADMLTFATAGHPPPLLLDLDGHVRFLDTANAPMIGVNATLTIADTVPFAPPAHNSSPSLTASSNATTVPSTSASNGWRHISPSCLHTSPRQNSSTRYSTPSSATKHADDIAILVVEHLS